MISNFDFYLERTLFSYVICVSDSSGYKVRQKPYVLPFGAGDPRSPAAKVQHLAFVNFI
jgi:hypothetical protein